MLFHTGALIRLNELGLLKQLRRVSSVSGGSISAGFLGFVWKRLTWDNDNVATNFDDEYVARILRFSRRSIDYICGSVGFFTQGLLVGPVVAWFYDQFLFKGASLQDLPSDEEGPRFVICATNLSTGSLWRFSKPYMADWRLGRIPWPNFPLSRAVAASSAFPPVLSPLRIDLSRYTFEPDDLRPREDELHGPPLPDKLRRRAVLTYGGAYDNHGLEPVDEWPTLFVSDGGAPHSLTTGGQPTWYHQLARVLEVEDNQVRSLRRRQLIHRFQNAVEFARHSIGADDPFYRHNAGKGAYWGIGTNPKVYGAVGGLECAPERAAQLARVKTALRDYGDETRAELVNWGYAVCDKALRRWYLPQAAAATRWPMPGGIGGRQGKITPELCSKHT